MSTALAGQAEVDVCPECSGVWLDWMDGEVSLVSRRIGPLPAAHPAHSAAAHWLCPCCKTELYDQAAAAGGPLVHRCGDCAGTFVPLGTLQELARAEPASAVTSPGQASTLARMLDTLHRWLFG